MKFKTNHNINHKLSVIMWFYLIWSYIYWYLRKAIKWFLRKTTKFCELQRICYLQPVGMSRTSKVEICLRNSSRPQIRGLLTVLDARAMDKNFYSGRLILVPNAVSTIARVKRIDQCEYERFSSSLGQCVDNIWSYIQLIEEIKATAAIKYDCCNDVHEKSLFLLWDELKPDDQLENRVTKQWQDIGFQGDDPKTDFRGMGILGLDNLVYFASKYTYLARIALSHSMHPIHGYAFAIVGINLTNMALELVVDGSAKTHFYNKRNAPEYEDFNEFYCYLFWEFDKFWLNAKPKDLMEFTIHRENFEKVIRKRLNKYDTIFQIDVPTNETTEN
ncbi:ELMO domain-containing protein 2 [Daktulosphaira vitifoliae]|uniref:ELMO domain-containing protein 2 n=1 Tax=Daktulosphaira vitifoliae TaxID=58002 RepID=UPI0021AADB14|nr:ELMO domain-containing protein 2 [Daktulosphaira vitifoliae]